jgi:hypothetical protein
MKKHTKPRLVLHRETISVLTVEELLRMQGGRPTQSQSLSTGPTFGCPQTRDQACNA